jgi:hypothetical protein
MVEVSKMGVRGKPRQNCGDSASPSRDLAEENTFKTNEAANFKSDDLNFTFLPEQFIFHFLYPPFFNIRNLKL